MPEAQDCIFCNIVSGRLPSFRIYEDEEYVAFLDIRPLNPGHALVVPKLHFRWTYDVPRYGEYFEVVRRVGLAVMSALGAESFSVITLGHEIPHAHVWVIPRFPNDGHPGFINWNNVKEISREDMEMISAKIRENLERG